MSRPGGRSGVGFAQSPTIRQLIAERHLKDLYCRIGELRPYGSTTEAAHDVTELVKHALRKGLIKLE